MKSPSLSDHDAVAGPWYYGAAGLHGHTPTSTDDRYERHSIDGSSTISTDGLASEQMLGDGDISFRHTHGEDVASSSDGSSPLGWPLGRTDRPSGEPSPSSSELNRSRDLFMWEEKREKRQTVLSEVELMKERFAKLLLGDDMSGGAKGVCTALAISNAITNLSGICF
jgi:hypothetical protein